MRLPQNLVVEYQKQELILFNGAGCIFAAGFVFFERYDPCYLIGIACFLRCVDIFILLNIVSSISL